MSNDLDRHATPGTVYLDSQGTERPRPQVVAAMLPYLLEDFGNPSALAHPRGRAARAAVEAARESIAAAVGADSEGIIFTSGATEANNMVIASTENLGSRTLICSAIEHKSVIEPMQRQARQGRNFRQARVGRDGILDLQHMVDQGIPACSLVSVMMVNNEIGTIQPIKEVARLCRAAGALLHVDAAQACGKVPIDFRALDIDFLTISAHKFGGPQGIGCLVVRPGLVAKLAPLMVGGGQEGGLRSGTTALALCHGMGVAAKLATANIADDTARLAVLRDDLLAGLSSIGPFFLNGSPSQRVAGSVNGGYRGVSALSLMRALPDLHFSIGSACTTGATDNHVLNAMNVDKLRQGETFRMSLGWATTRAEVDRVISRVTEVLPRFLSAKRAVAG